MNINFDFLDSEEFYNLMQDYRNAPTSSRDQYTAFDIYCDIKKYIKLKVQKQINREQK